jgi:hypothetical protein
LNAQAEIEKYLFVIAMTFICHMPLAAKSPELSALGLFMRRYY